jgi:hypothetical protein
MTTVEFDTNRPSRSHSAVPQGIDSVWQRLWFATLESPWTSLAIVPSDPGIDTTVIAESFAAAGRCHGARSVQIVNGVGAAVSNVEALGASVAAGAARGDLVVVPVDAIDENSAAIPLIRICSAVLLAVRIGDSRVASAKAVVEIAGAVRVVGSVVIG